jgi:hypothetical protein
MKDDNTVCTVFDVHGDTVRHRETVHAATIGDKVLIISSSESKESGTDLPPHRRRQL